MARSLERYGQLSPVVVCRRQERYELIDGLKRLGAARGLAQIPHLSARLMEADERTAKAAIYGLNRAGGRTRELEEAWIIQALVSAGGRVEPGGGGGAVGTAPELGVPPAGADRAVAGGQPGGSVGSDPAGGVVERGTGRHGAPLAGVCRTSPARVSSGASSRSALPGQGSGPGGARSAIDRSRKPGMEARRAAAGCAGPHGCVAGAPGAHGADASGSRDLAVPFRDPAIALLDAWAVVADVLTFYQERIANEGYLPTATERRSLLELARLVNYTLRPGVSASVYLAFTVQSGFSGTIPAAGCS